MTTKIIFTSPKRNTYIRIRNICITIVILFSILFRRDEGQAIATTLLGKYAAEIVLFVYFSSIVSLITLHILSRKKRILGKIEMTKESLTVQIRKSEQIFKIDKFSNFKIFQNLANVKNEPVGLISSYDNRISFEYENINYIFQFILESMYQNNQFNELKSFWMNNTDIEFIEQ
jgi:hypothetical protein